MSVVGLRAASRDDVPTIRALEQEVFGLDAWSEDSVEQELAAEGRQWLVAHDAERLLGYAVTWTVGEVADLQRLVVAPAARRRGIGRRLVSEIVEDADRRGARRVLLEVSARNEAALRCYRSFGFAEIDRRTSYYRDGSDALVLQRDLTIRPTKEPQ